jgi:hypothetical protein
MLNKQFFPAMLVTCGLTLGLTLVLVGSARAQAIVSSETSDGSVELSNLSAPDSQPPVSAEAGPDATAAAPAVAAADSTTAEAPKDPREQYRDMVMKVPEGQPMSATSAVSRRYKKMDKAAYQANVLDSAAQTAPAPQAGGNTAN